MWDILTKTALVGTGKAAPLTDQSQDTLQAFVQAMHDKSPEYVLLAAAAAMTLRQRTGYLPPVCSDDLPEAAPDDELPVCSERLVQILVMLLQERDLDAADTWLHACIDSKQRVPAHIVPALLKGYARRKDSHALVRQVVGKRGHWLAQFKSQWEKMLQATSEPTGSDRESLVSLLANEPTQPRTMKALANHKQPWDEEISWLVLEHIQRCAEHTQTTQQVSKALEQYARYFTPTLLHEAQKQLTPLTKPDASRYPLPYQISLFLDKLKLRHDIHIAFEKEKTA